MMVFCRVKKLNNCLRKVEKMIIQNVPIAAVSQLTEVTEELEDRRSKLEFLLDSAGLALGAAMQGTRMPPEVEDFLPNVGSSSGLHFLTEKLEEAYRAYSAAAADVSKSFTKPVEQEPRPFDFTRPEHVVQHTEHGGLVDQVAGMLPLNSARFGCMVVTLVLSNRPYSVQTACNE
jgi:hypothetical protein